MKVCWCNLVHGFFWTLHSRLNRKFRELKLIFSYLSASSTRMPEKVMHMAIFLCELALLEADPYLAHPPSLIASGAIALAYHCMDHVDVWPHDHQKTTGYTLKQLAPVVNSLNDTHEKSFQAAQQATREKYRAAKYLVVSRVPHRKLSIRLDWRAWIWLKIELSAW